MVIIDTLMQPCENWGGGRCRLQRFQAEQGHTDMQRWYVHSQWTISPLPKASNIRTINVGKRCAMNYQQYKTSYIKFVSRMRFINYMSL